MMNLEACERCEGSGADPMQALSDDVVALCSECRGDGVLMAVDVVEERMLLSA